ncbi:hypothetical protein V6N12_049530 [Hibiscus sabdariffa]|uniref:Uncharacterized protein n=1 Tax=Hibiscus sabdariffa TaxID=183260 RepID=A0ABR2CBL0_9ROSI
MRVVWERLVWCRCIEKEGYVELGLVFVMKDRRFVRDWMRDMLTDVGGILVTIWVIEIVGFQGGEHFVMVCVTYTVVMSAGYALPGLCEV